MNMTYDEDMADEIDEVTAAGYMHEQYMKIPNHVRLQLETYYAVLSSGKTLSNAIKAEEQFERLLVEYKLTQESLAHILRP